MTSITRGGNHSWKGLLSDPTLNGGEPSRRQKLSLSAASLAIFKCGVTYSLGDGQKVGWWTDIWMDQAPLRTLYPHIYDSVRNKNYRVKDCWGTNGWKWNKIMAGFVLRSQMESDLILNLKESVHEFSPRSDTDVVRWRWEPSEKFTVRSLYNFLQDGGVPDRRFVQL